MARTIRVVIEKEVTPEDEIAVIRKARGRELNLVPSDGWLELGTVLICTRARPQRPYVEGQAVVVARSGPPDTENDYFVYYMTDEGGVDESYIRADCARVYVPVEPEPPSRRRALMLDDHPTGAQDRATTTKPRRGSIRRPTQ